MQIVIILNMDSLYNCAFSPVSFLLEKKLKLYNCVYMYMIIYVCIVCYFSYFIFVGDELYLITCNLFYLFI